ncbi:hypothetical protein KKHLCK_11330 [Candidatus Electrothrix laxa]
MFSTEMNSDLDIDMNGKAEVAQEIEDFIQDWHWSKKSHAYARDLCKYLFQFFNELEQQGLSEKTIRKHTDNCWHIGILECQYGYRNKFVPGEVFYSPEADYDYEFKRKVSDSAYAVNSYKSTWRKIYKYTKTLGLIE